MTRSLAKLHTWMALIAFIPLLVICITGSILVFKHEIDSLLMPDKVRVVDQGERQSLDSLLNNIHSNTSGYEVVGWVLFQDPARADLVYVMQHGTSDWSYLLLNQYTGEMLAEPQSTTHYVTDWLLNLHYELLLGHTGLLLSSIISILLCLLGVSGILIYRKFWKNFFTLRWNKRLTVFFNDLHKMTGIIASPVLLILGATGAYWNITHFIHEEIEHAGEEHHVMQSRLYNDQLSLQDLHDATPQHIDGFKPTYIQMPYEPGIGITFFGEVPGGNFLTSEYASTVGYDPTSGAFKNAADIRAAGFWAKTVDSFRHLHFGTFGGLFTRIVWCVLGLAPVLLSVTGLYIWYQRRAKRTSARQKRKRPLVSVGEQPLRERFQ